MATLFKYGMWAVCRLEQPGDLWVQDLPPCLVCGTAFGGHSGQPTPADEVISRSVNRWDVHYFNLDRLQEREVELLLRLLGSVDEPVCESCTCLVESLLYGGGSPPWSQPFRNG